MSCTIITVRITVKWLTDIRLPCNAHADVKLEWKCADLFGPKGLDIPTLFQQGHCLVWNAFTLFSVERVQLQIKGDHEVICCMRCRQFTAEADSI